jgi:hypothetical protein
MEVAYWFPGKMFDYVATKADGTSVAVSVTRVLDNSVNAYCADKTRRFLEKKTDSMLTAARSMSKVQHGCRHTASHHTVARRRFLAPPSLVNLENA